MSDETKISDNNKKNLESIANIKKDKKTKKDKKNENTKKKRRFEILKNNLIFLRDNNITPSEYLNKNPLNFKPFQFKESIDFLIALNMTNLMKWKANFVIKIYYFAMIISIKPHFTGQQKEIK